MSKRSFDELLAKKGIKPTNFVYKPILPTTSQSHQQEPTKQQTVAKANLKAQQEFIKCLNDQQRTIYDEIVEKNKPQLKMFITGEAGTGKSYLIKALSFIDGYGIVAPTAVCAAKMDAKTIHKFFMIPFDADFHKRPFNRSVANKIAQLDTLVVDEISMVKYKLFNCMNLICQQSRNDSRFFGGLNVILVGDFFQLQPIFDPGESSKLLFEYPEIWNQLDVKILIQNMRQNDNVFIQNLNRIRRGVELDTAIDYFNQFYDPNIDKIEISKRKDMVYITPLCSTAKKINIETMLWFKNEFEKNHTSSDMDDSQPVNSNIERKKIKLNEQQPTVINNSLLMKCKENTLEGNDDNIISKNRTCISVCAPVTQRTLIHRTMTKISFLPKNIIPIPVDSLDATVPEILIIYTGMRLMVTKNLTPEIFNGLSVYVEKIENFMSKNQQTLTASITVSYDVKGFKAYHTFSGISDFYTYKSSEGSWYCVKGLALTYGYATTINKSQGQTLPAAIINLKGTFTTGMAYVALSRLPNTNHLKLVHPLRKNQIMVDPNVLAFNEIIKKFSD